MPLSINWVNELMEHVGIYVLFHQAKLPSIKLTAIIKHLQCARHYDVIYTIYLFNSNTYMGNIW